jgi:diguanylate cyclase (GGDEF)-like protein
MYRYLAAAIASMALVVWFVVGLLADASVQRAVGRDATNKALHWGHYMSWRIPDLGGLIATGVPTQEQFEAIQYVRHLGDVFRFKLFDAHGRLVLISDDAFISDPQGIAADYDPEPLEVVQTGMDLVEVFDGTQKPDRPDLYAEAYVPLVDSNGSIYGVVEVYVDQTVTQHYFADSFKSFGLFISALSALLFLVPSIGFSVQRARAQRSSSKADYLSKFDALTGVLNRAEFARRAEASIAEGQLTALLFVDADNFKSINDTYGHAAGDKYLEKIGRILTANTDARDLVSRYGGDEFVVALNAANHEATIRCVRSILHLCSEPVDVNGRKMTASVSVGVSFVNTGSQLEKFTAEADAALYYAKAAGRNQYAIYGDDMGEEIRRRNLLETRIKEAFESEEFALEYQPLVGGNDHQLIGYEALMRLRHTDGTSIPPAEFIPLAEEIGLIDKMGEWAIFEATREVAKLPGGLKVAINLSAIQFRSGRLPQLVADALRASQLPAEKLELEITESVLLDADPAVALQIDSLQDMGVSIAMDDFGTGFSSLGYLWKFGFDRIKIDRSFVSGLNDNPERSLEIIESVVMLGKRLGMQVTAEGVETQEQSELLSELGCDVLQGYLYGRPAVMEAQQATHVVDFEKPKLVRTGTC